MWKKWKKITKQATEIQIDIFFTILYVLILIPVSFLIKKELLKTMQIKNDRNKKSYWIRKEKFIQNLEWAHKQ